MNKLSETDQFVEVAWVLKCLSHFLSRIIQNMVFRRKTLLDELVNNKDEEYKLVKESIDSIISLSEIYTR